ncbi:MAG: pyridoxal phosphate-dependent aminotransferase [Candidatus Omnitrophota bacterium]|nr:pyridoxal phosphate-dependent aminotransferase [Candidatus Omnitrophota bacterium]
MKLAQRIQNVSGSLTLEITSRAKKLRQEGFDVINFAAGEPDFDTPEFIKEAAIKAIHDGFTKYTPSSGILELKSAISRKFKNENRLNYNPSQIVVSCGAKHSIYNLIQVLTESGDEVIIPSPYWVSYPEMVKLAEATAVILRAYPNENLKINISCLKQAITSKTKLLILNSPSNPTGVVYNPDELKEIAKVCIQNKILVISDEIYEHLIYDGQSYTSIASLGKEIYDLTITVNGVSKAFSMTGWRIGYLGASEEIACAVSKFQDHSTSNPTSISQKAAFAALEAKNSWLKKLCLEFEERRNLMLQCLDNISALSYIKPQGAFYVFSDISKLGLDSHTFVKRLLEEENVALIPGEGFGMENYVRLSFATSKDKIKLGMERIERWVKQLLKKS